MTKKEQATFRPLSKPAKLTLEDGKRVSILGGFLKGEGEDIKPYFYWGGETSVYSCLRTSREKKLAMKLFPEYDLPRAILSPPVEWHESWVYEIFGGDKIDPCIRWGTSKDQYRDSIWNIPFFIVEKIYKKVSPDPFWDDWEI